MRPGPPAGCPVVLKPTELGSYGLEEYLEVKALQF